MGGPEIPALTDQTKQCLTREKSREKSQEDHTESKSWPIPCQSMYKCLVDSGLSYFFKNTPS